MERRGGRERERYDAKDSLEDAFLNRSETRERVIRQGIGTDHIWQERVVRCLQG